MSDVYPNSALLSFDSVNFPVSVNADPHVLDSGFLDQNSDTNGTVFEFPNLLSEFVYTRTYARYMDDAQRRETWPETVARYVQFIRKHRNVPESLLEEIEEAIVKMEVLPSMRALWSAGVSAERDNTCMYNCSFLPIDSLRSWSEVLYILMQGTGVGFSVERQFVNNLPKVAELTGETVDYVIPDSTEGWADALYFGMTQWFKGNKVNFDYSEIRPLGAPLKTKGGRASGPGPLMRLMDFAEETVLNASGRKLGTLECHDITCMIADIVVVGGTRRSSLISFSDPDDESMRGAKDWTSGQFPPIRYMANNSAFYAERPSKELFDREWASLVRSGSGERGFSMGNWHLRGDRPSDDVRSNPCVTGDTRVMTSQGMIQIQDLVGQQANLILDSRFGVEGYGEMPKAWKTGHKEIFHLQTKEGFSLRLTEDHRVMTSRGWVHARDLTSGDQVHIMNQGGSWGSERPHDREIGMLSGWLAGDGSLVDDKVPRLYFYDQDRELTSLMVDAAEKVTGSRPSVSYYQDHREHFQHAPLREYLGQLCEDKFRVPEFVWRGSKAVQSAYISALFTADGSVQGTQEKGFSVRLHQTHLGLLQDVQQLLLNFGIFSKIYQGRMPAGNRWLPDGKGGHALYACAESHELVISKSNLFTYAEEIGFLRSDKTEKLNAVLDSYSRGPYAEKFLARVVSVESVGMEDVYDLTENKTHSFGANGIVVHNCHEIGLRFRRATNPWTGEGGCGQFCNLSAAVMRSWDTEETMARKVYLATWLGAIQASFTEFPYLRPGWKELCDEDRLLGVDITGQCDNLALSMNPDVMKRFNKKALDTACEATDFLGINFPAAITCGKPSGNSSQLVDCASGFHTRHSEYYFRHVRIAASDPLFKMIHDQGVPLYKENGQEERADEDVETWVARFPVKSPEGAMLRDAERAIEQCERYLHIMQTWISERGHNQSATIYVRKEEWDEVGEWVWKNFDDIIGLSFLPYDGGSYRLAPYVEITKEEYEQAVEEMPAIDFSALRYYEVGDQGEGAREYACVGGSCEI